MPDQLSETYKKAATSVGVQEFKKGQEIDAYLKSEAARRREGAFFQDQAMHRGPGDRPVIDEIFEALKPDQWSLAQLKKQNVEAFRAQRAFCAAGHCYEPGDILLPWPVTPLKGFTTKEQLQTLSGVEVEKLPDGSWKVLDPFFLGGHKYQEGDVIEIWPDVPTVGFLKPTNAIELLRDGSIEPAELAPVES